jgi:dTDP-L-oleandrosyltransferase
MMTTGEVTLAVGSLPPNVFATDFAPGERLLERADVCVSHGGNGTLYQALTAGVPVVGIPTHVDQQIQMQLCEASGVGLQVPDSVLSPERLRQAVDTVCADPRFRESARAMSRAIARHGGARSAAAAIVELLERRYHGRPRAPRAAAG